VDADDRSIASTLVNANAIVEKYKKKKIKKINKTKRPTMSTLVDVNDRSLVSTFKVDTDDRSLAKSTLMLL
jgi:succinate dehydrogenase flavin-adding protein (antitoxin of CptAB toxin-antitoxin module)